MTSLVLLVVVGLPVPSGWKATRALETYDQQTVFDAINGAADLYLAFGFRELRVRDYERGEHGVVVSVYDMGEPLNALGVLFRERPTRSRGLEVGSDGLVTPRLCLTRKGGYYVKATAYRGTLDAGVCGSLLRPIVATLPGSLAVPPELSRLPPEDLITGTAAYTHTGYLGLSELDRCVHANYRTSSGESYRRFFVLPRGDDTVEKMWERLAKRWQGGADATGVMRRQVPYTGWVTLRRSGDGLAGVVHEDSGRAVELLRRPGAK